MRDTRFLQPGEITRAAERREAIDRIMSEVPKTDRAEIDHLLAEWWTEVLAQDSVGEQLKIAQVEKLRTKCFSLPVESRTFALTAPKTLALEATDENRGVGARLLGESAAAKVRCVSSIVALYRAVNILSECWEAVEVLIERLLEEPAWPEAMETLAPATTDLAGLIGRQFNRMPSNDVLLDEERKARARGLSTYLWGRHFDIVFLNCSTLVRLTLLASRDWESLASHADTLPLRAFRECLWRHLHLDEDRDAILSLLRAAPPVFDDKIGRQHERAGGAERRDYTRGSTPRPLTQLTRSYPPPPDADKKLKALVEHEIPDWLKQVAQVAIARPDGRRLLLFFGTHLIRGDLLPPEGGQRSWSSARHALCAIYGVLDSKPSVAELRQVGNLGGVPTIPNRVFARIGGLRRLRE